jgi:hypothetical protein
LFYKKLTGKVRKSGEIGNSVNARPDPKAARPGQDYQFLAQEKANLEGQTQQLHSLKVKSKAIAN